MAACVARLSAQSGSDLTAAIAKLGSLDYPPRMAAARAVRRTAAPEAATALIDAVTRHADEYVRFRAFVLLSGFNDSRTPGVVRSILRDRNDRLREAAYGWLERHPDPAISPFLLGALETEQAEFVRPALIRALAAHDADERVRTALVREVSRGLDIFRGSVIEALGYRRASYAAAAIAVVAANDGPLQDDAGLALGRIGGPPAVQALSGLMVKGAEARVTIATALCMARGNCDAQREQLVRELTGNLAGVAAPALAALAERGDQAALTALIAGGKTPSVRDHVAVALASVAVRRPADILAWLGAHAADRDTAIELLHEGFEMLEEDLAEESFFAAMRASYWQAPEGSDLRTAAAALIDKLEF
jgi:HEAT repeat protein